MNLEAQFERARAADDTAALAYAFAAAAALQTEARGRAFMLTQAYTLGLDAGLSDAADWREALVELGAEEANDPA